MQLIKKPSAWVPIALSLVGLAFMLSLLAIHGVPTPDENKDEGVAAHLFQLWLVLEVLMIGFFAVRWLPKKPREALLVLGLQVELVIITCSPVFLLHL
jgi:hypothetical protein